MRNWNYFQILCFFWAFVGIASRIVMIFLGKKWVRWELESAYGKEKPVWLYAAGAFAVIIIGYSWFMVFTTEIKYSWIITALVSLTIIKVYMLIFQYDKFRKFAVNILNDKKKMLQLNILVILFSLVFISMGVFLY